ncbi:MAG: hypothetical protein ACKVOP_05260 [Sphingomonadaceae bacterium]
MALIPRSFSPRAAWRDLRGFVGEKHEHGWLFALLSVLIVSAIIGMIAIQFAAEREYREAEVTYVKQWNGNRTVEEVRAQQLKDQPAERAERKAAEDARLERQEQFKRVQNMMESVGM